MQHLQWKDAVSEFPVSPGSAEALARWGGKIKYSLIAYFLDNIFAKNCHNRTVYVKIIASQRWDVIFETQCSFRYEGFAAKKFKRTLNCLQKKTQMEEKLTQIRWILCEMKTTVMNSRVGPNSPASQVSLDRHCVAHLQRLQSAQDIDVPSCTSNWVNVPSCTSN